MITPDAALLTDNVIVVTGAAQGIGKAAAISLARFGADLAICDRKPELEATADEIRKLGRKVVTGYFDVRDADAVASHLGDVKAELGRVDVLVNNAGGGFVSPFLDVSDKGTKALMDENYTQVLHFIRGCVPLFPETGGSIINITSVEAHRAAPGFAIYASMKAALEQLTRSLALEFADRWIRVNCIAVDAIATEGDHDLAEAVGGLPSQYQIPWPRYGTPDDMAGPIIFLASDLSRFVTGSTV
ncbi:MAG: short-chain dehydrogenase, partial [Actinomycetia bacterium]|nr:short-chain dehydrogenase [Actinomycetes bacterium]